MVVSVEAGKEGIQTLRTTRRFVHQSDLTANSQGLLKGRFALNLDRRMSSSSAYSGRILIVYLHYPGIHPLGSSFDYERYLPSNRLTFGRKCFQTDQALANCTMKLCEMLHVEPDWSRSSTPFHNPPRSHAENEQKKVVTKKRYIMTHLHPGDLCRASDPLPRRSLPPFVSSSSM